MTTVNYPEVSGVENAADGKIVVIDMGGGNYTITARQATASSFLLYNTGTSSTLTFPASPANCPNIAVAILGDPIIISSGETYKSVVFKRSQLLYAYGYGYIPIESQETIAARMGTEITAGNTTEQIIQQQFLPAGSLFQNDESIDVAFSIEKSAGVTTETLRIRLGTLGTTADAALWTNASALAGASATVYGLITIARVDDTTVRIVSTQHWHVPFAAGAATMTDVTVPSLRENGLYLSITGQNSTGAETVSIKRFGMSITR